MKTKLSKTDFKKCHHIMVHGCGGYQCGEGYNSGSHLRCLLTVRECVHVMHKIGPPTSGDRSMCSRAIMKHILAEQL